MPINRVHSIEDNSNVWLICRHLAYEIQGVKICMILTQNGSRSNVKANMKSIQYNSDLVEKATLLCHYWRLCVSTSHKNGLRKTTIFTKSYVGHTNCHQIANCHNANRWAVSIINSRQGEYVKLYLLTGPQVDDGYGTNVFSRSREPCRAHSTGGCQANRSFGCVY